MFKNCRITFQTNLGHFYETQIKNISKMTAQTSTDFKINSELAKLIQTGNERSCDVWRWHHLYKAMYMNAQKPHRHSHHKSEIHTLTLYLYDWLILSFHTVVNISLVIMGLFSNTYSHFINISVNSPA